MVFLLGAAVFGICVCSALCYTYTNEKDVRTVMFNGYSDSIRPVLDQNSSVQVHFTLELLNVEYLDVKTQTLAFTIWVVVKWIDENMIWNSSMYDGANKFFVHDGDVHDVWRPDISISNTIDTFERLGNSDVPTVVRSNGEVTMEAGKVIKTHCEIDMTYYLFDSQSCEIEIGAWVYTAHEVNMTTKAVNLDNYHENGEWKIASVNAERHDLTFDQEPQSVIRYTLKFFRRRPFFTMHIILPMLFLSVPNVVVFLLPPDAGEKMSLSITNLLAFAVFLNLFSDHMPHSSTHTPAISEYLAATFIINVFTVVVATVVLRLHYHEGPVPIHLKTLYCQCLSKTLCSRNTSRRVCNPQFMQYHEEEKARESPVDVRHPEASLDLVILKDRKSPAALSISNGSRRLDIDHVLDWRTIARIADWMAFLTFLTATFIINLVVVLRLVLN